MQIGRLSGLLQTEDYMRALFIAFNPWESEESIEQRVRARIQTGRHVCSSRAALSTSASSKRPLCGGWSGPAR